MSAQVSPAGAQVLQAFDEAALDQLEAGLDEQLLGERVADLDAWPLARRSSSPNVALASTLAPPMPSRPVVEPNSTHEVAGPRARPRAIRSRSRSRPTAITLTSGFASYAAVEDELAADGRDADAVAVAAHAAHHAVEQAPRARQRRIAEPQRVEHGDRARAHGEDVAQDAADAGRRALVRLDRARVVVALHLEHDGEAVADLDRRRRSRPARRPRRGRRAAAGQQRARALVRAVLAPHHREDGQLEVVGRAAQPLDDRVQLEVGQRRAARWRPAARRSRASTPSGRPPRAAAAALSTSERNSSMPSSEPSSASAARSGWGISPHDVAALVAHAGDVAQRAVGIARAGSGRRRGRRASSASSARSAVEVAPSPCAIGMRSDRAGRDRLRERRVRRLDRDCSPSGARSAGSRCAAARRAAGAPRPAPGSRCRCPAPAAAARRARATAPMTGLKRAMTPARR